MDEFLRTVAAFPTLLFTAALVVVLGFWLLVLLGAVGHDGFDGDLDASALGLGGVPVTVSASLFIALGWFLSLTGSVLLAAALGPLVLMAALGGSWWLTRLIARPLATLFPDEPGPSRHDFIGLTCTIRTGRVDAGFGQAEVTARDGSTAVVQVRQSAEDAYALSSGSSALLYAYDSAGEFFWVAPS
ncbi:hypothetical protein ACWD4V_03640 [Streptomyces tsukubensis]|uniref:hypothetical protein n=1 Tax=Streptomyces tsukubensis TaxID=83656 RepID=UPI0036D17176